MYTQHGHHIPGTVLEDRPQGLMTARCGGVKICKDCAIDATKALTPEVREIVEEANKPQKVYYTKEAVDKLYEVLNKSGLFNIDETFRVINALQEAGIVMKDRVTHDQDTMTKVFGSFERAGLSAQQGLDIVADMQNQGILFREGRKR